MNASVYRSIPVGVFDSPAYLKLSAVSRSVLFHTWMNVGPWGLVVWYADEASARIANQSGFAQHDVDAAFAELEGASWTARDGNVLWVKSHLGQDPHMSPANPKHRKSLHRHLAGLPRLPIVGEFAVAYSEWIPKGEAIAMDIVWVLNGNRVAIGSRSKDSDSHSEKDSEEEATPATATTVVCEEEAEQIRVAAVRELIPDEFRPDLDNLMSHVPDREVWAKEIQTRISSASPSVVGQAIRDMAANGKLEVPNARQFGRYVDGVIENSKTGRTTLALSGGQDATVGLIVDACSSGGIFTAINRKDLEQRCAALAETSEFSADEIAALARIDLAFCAKASQRNDRAGLKRHIGSLLGFRPAPEQQRKHRTNGARPPVTAASVSW